MSRYVASFEPQAWQNDYANPVDPEGETDWDCTDYIREYLEPDGSLRSPFRKQMGLGRWLDNDDILKSDPAAPEWVREWQGPFTIVVRRLEGNRAGSDA